MSATFYCPEAPTTREEHEWGEVSHSPHECNFSNANARNILALLSKRLNLSGPGVGGWPELYGEWSQVDLPEVQRTILQVSNVVGLREWMVTEPEVIQEPGRCTFIETGNTDEMTLRRLRSLSELVAYAAKNNYRICWS